ncbi:Crp/Fnr family transcriptional regulator [Paracraurococcus lichenis]|uniref:Crp/Fnr family transcriptional regulator n=1 Tax=Paracraurococcus lichenis TaxID=3064888 RepID=A0ABT9DYN8_9PROT|nr:Crp/Fnr family transcriptional regulator [Paracraurococcus sp. LOR1-02]MDO9709028.1 Crp/Fnr family transcriptional regulator [Paracraurococcus sp. LOR1-02]
MNPFDAPRQTELAAAAQVCDRCGSRVAGLCQPLDSAALDEISSEAQQMTMPAHAAVFREGDPAGRIFTLVDGFAKLTRLLPDGKQQVVGFRFAGDVIGYTTLPTYPFDAELLTESRLCRLDRGQLDALLRRYPTLERRMLDLCVQELTATQEQLVTVGRRSAEARVAAFLLSLVEASRRRNRPCSVLEMPMTRSDIADFLGLTLETVSRSLTAFRKRGWIREPVHHRVELVNFAALSALAEGTDD